MKACSRPALHQVIYQIALYSKIAAAITLLFRTTSSKWFIAVWIIICESYGSKVFDAEDYRSYAHSFCDSRLANAVLIGMNAFEGNCTEATKASLVYDVLSTVLVIVLILLTVFWPVDILKDSQNMGSAGIDVSTAAHRNEYVPAGEDGGLSNMSNSASARNNSSM
uniref:Uncharacterized protein n=1 Tax=Ditylenchus dipsaci TaxID=166011 RepID=A0A915EPR4_9BILA